MAEIFQTRDLELFLSKFKNEFHPIYDGQIHRFGPKKSGWFIGHDMGDLKIIIASDYAEMGDDYCKYISKGNPLKKQSEFISKKIEDAVVKKNEIRKVYHDECRANYEGIKCHGELKGFEYFRIKKIDKPYGGVWGEDCFLVPMADINNVVWNYQRIWSNGEKKFMPGRSKGLFHVIGEESERVLVCEGFATGVSLHQATGLRVIVCFSAHNVVEVCSIYKEKGLNLLVCSDNDCWRDGGKNAGIEAAKKTGLPYVFPVFNDGRSTDFNDMMILQGPDAVKNIVFGVKDIVSTSFSLPTMATMTDEIYESYVAVFETIPEVMRSRKDFLTGQIKYWSGSQWEPIINYLPTIKSICVGQELKRDQVEDNFLRYCFSMKPSWLFEVPEWDGKDRIGYMTRFIRVTNVSQESFEQYMKMWFAGMIRRTFDSDSHNFLPILQGGQGLGKSRWTKDICSGFGPYYTNLGESANEMNIQMACSSHLIINFGEFDKLMKLHPAFIKELISSEGQTFRPPYQRAPSFHPFKVSYIASCNSNDYLVDHTGNRRFVVFHVEDISWDYELTQEDRLQIVAQSFALYREGFKVSDDNAKVMTEFIASMTPDDPYELALSLWDTMSKAKLDELNEEFLIPLEHLEYENVVEIINHISKHLGIGTRKVLSMLKREKRQVLINNDRKYISMLESKQNTDISVKHTVKNHAQDIEIH